MSPSPVLPRRIVPNARPSRMAPAQVDRELRRRSDDGAALRPAGEARRHPARLLARYAPKYKIELFGLGYYLAEVCQNEDIRFFVAYVAMPSGGASPAGIYPRLFYKDGSLLWRSASHFARTADENWIGKGDVETRVVDGRERVFSAEHTTDLPLEIQDAVEAVSRRAAGVAPDSEALSLVVRRCGPRRIPAYRDFTEPRRRALANPRNRVNGGRPIARFLRHEDPDSLRFAAGFEPDFGGGVLARSFSRSKLYYGRVARYRILSRNRKVQYLFFAGPRHVWIGYPQATTTELSSYGVRTVDVVVPDDLVVPGMEYHYLETDDPPVWMSQIPAGFVGEPSPSDPYRWSAAPWLDRLPVIREFRKKILGQR